MKNDHGNKNRPQFKQFWARYRIQEHDEYVPPLQIVVAGSERWKAGQIVRRDQSELFGLEYVLEGDVDFVQNGRTYRVQPGQVYLLRKGCAHTYRTGPAGYLYKQYIVMEGVLLESILRATGLDTQDCVVPENSAVVEKIFGDIISLMERKPRGFAFELSTVAYRLIALLGRSVARRYPDSIRVAVEYIDRNIGMSLTTEQICAVAGLSQTHFNRLFRRHVGISAKQFYLRNKMAWASHLLTATGLSVKEIAGALGYDDPLYFSGQFRMHTGLSPRFFRKYRGDIHAAGGVSGGS